MGSALLVPRSTIDRHPFVVLEQVIAPMYSLLLVEIAMVVCVPSPIAMELGVTRVMVLMSTTSNIPVAPPGYPATYKLLPFRVPTLAPPTATVPVIVCDGMSKRITEGVPLPEAHSGPQFST